MTNKLYFILFAFLFALFLSSCAQHPDQAAEPEIEHLNQTANTLVEAENDLSPPEPALTPETNEKLDELNSLNNQVLDLSSDNDELKKKLDKLTQEFNELKQRLLNKLNKTNDLQ